MRLTSRQLQRTVNQKKEQTLRPLHDVLIHPGGAEICVTSDDEEPRVLYSLEEAFLWADYSYVKALTLGAVTWTETDGSTMDTSFRKLTIKAESVNVQMGRFKRAPADVLGYIAQLCSPGGSFSLLGCMTMRAQFGAALFRAAADAGIMRYYDWRSFNGDDDNEGISNADGGILAFLCSDLEGSSTSRYLKSEYADIVSPQFPTHLVQAAEAGTLKSFEVDIPATADGTFSKKHAAFVAREDMFERVYDFGELGLSLNFKLAYGRMLASYEKL